MGLSISFATVNMLRCTAEKLKGNCICIQRETHSLKRIMTEYKSCLGPHGIYVENILQKSISLEEDVERETNNLIQRILELAGQMETYIMQNESMITVSKTSDVIALQKEKQPRVMLSKTQQSYQTVFLEGRECKIFDHPDLIAQRGVYRQGHNTHGIEGTCGLCSSATVMNIAGYSYNENDVVDYAMEKGFCTEDGGTSANHRKQIIEGMGKILMKNIVGEPLQTIASYVEQGKGVILAVEASYLNPKWYDPMVPGGHAITLASVVRDTKTNEIVKYVIIDSNGKTPEEACQFVEPKVLEKAFEKLGAIANVTTEILH